MPKDKNRLASRDTDFLFLKVGDSHQEAGKLNDALKKKRKGEKYNPETQDKK